MSNNTTPDALTARIATALRTYDCQYTCIQDDGSGLPLVDKLNPPGETSITLGLQELELLAEHIADALGDEVEAAANKPSIDTEELATFYVWKSGKKAHTPDCATSQAPAFMPGPCDCDAVDRPADAGVTDEQIADIIREHLGDVYHCKRVWSAWGYGNMGESDFESAAASELADEIARALRAARALLAASPVQPTGELPPMPQLTGHVTVHPQLGNLYDRLGVQLMMVGYADIVAAALRTPIPAPLYDGVTTHPEFGRKNAAPDAPGLSDEKGRCCYGGIRTKRDCASCAVWAPLAPTGPVPVVRQEPIFHLRSFGDVTRAELERSATPQQVAQQSGPSKEWHDMSFVHDTLHQCRAMLPQSDGGHAEVGRAMRIVRDWRDALVEDAPSEAPKAAPSVAPPGVDGLVFCVAYGERREINGMFDTHKQAHAFVEWLKQFITDAPVTLGGGLPGDHNGTKAAPSVAQIELSIHKMGDAIPDYQVFISIGVQEFAICLPRETMEEATWLLGQFRKALTAAGVKA